MCGGGGLCSQTYYENLNMVLTSSLHIYTDIKINLIGLHNNGPSVKPRYKRNKAECQLLMYYHVLFLHTFFKPS
jgi:hypothetical protein